MIICRPNFVYKIFFIMLLLFPLLPFGAVITKQSDLIYIFPSLIMFFLNTWIILKINTYVVLDENDFYFLKYYPFTRIERRASRIRYKYSDIINIEYFPRAGMMRFTIFYKNLRNKKASFVLNELYTNFNEFYVLLIRKLEATQYTKEDLELAEKLEKRLSKPYGIILIKKILLYSIYGFLFSLYIFIILNIVVEWFWGFSFF